MQGRNKEHWLELCAQISEEEDRHKLIELVDNLNLLLEDEAKRLGILPHEHSEYSLSELLK